MAGTNPPKQPGASEERQKQTDYIPAISQQIGEPLRGIHNKVTAFVDEVKSDNEATETREQKHYDRSHFWQKISTIFSVILSFFSLIVAGLTLWILSNQLRANQD